MFWFLSHRVFGFRVGIGGRFGKVSNRPFVYVCAVLIDAAILAELLHRF